MAVRAIVLLLLLCLPQLGPRSSSVATDLFNAYAAGGDVDAAVANVRTANGFVLELKDAGISWIEAAPAEARRRRLVVASAALEVAASDLRGRGAQQLLLPWAAGLLAQDPPSDAERAWHHAANALVQRTYDPFFATFPAQGLTRFPDDDRLHLARALLNEQASWRAVQVKQRTGDRRGGDAMLRALATEFEALAKRTSIAAEARLRLGHTYLRLGRHAEAWTQLTRVEPLTHDPFLDYLSRYFSGRARLAMGDAPGASAAYRSALELVPRAQSASFALASLLDKAGDPAQAHRLVSDAIAGAETVIDPWRTYQEADYRFWPDLIAALRQVR